MAIHAQGQPIAFPKSVEFAEKITNKKLIWQND